MTLREKVQELGLEDLRQKGLIDYDYAYPQPWAESIYEKTGIWPHAIIWLYDRDGILGIPCGIFGRPYPVTLYAWQILKIAGEV